MPLGRGLQSLIPSSRPQPAVERRPLSSDKVWQIPVGEILPNPDQPRRFFDEDEMRELVGSIQEHGILQPLIVSEKADGNYELIAGERRLRAAKKAGLATVPAIVRVTVENERLELAIIENVQRVDLSALDEAFGYARLHDEFGLRMEDIAARVGKSRPHISNTIRLLDLPQEAKDALQRGLITAGKARALLSLSTEAEQLQLLHSMLGENMTTREVEAIAQLNSPRARIQKSADARHLEAELRALLGTKVIITQRGQRGIITIEYYSQEELESIIKKVRSMHT